MGFFYLLVCLAAPCYVYQPSHYHHTEAPAFEKQLFLVPGLHFLNLSPLTTNKFFILDYIPKPVSPKSQ